MRQDSGIGFGNDLSRAKERLELAQRQVDRPELVERVTPVLIRVSLPVRAGRRSVRSLLIRHGLSFAAVASGDGDPGPDWSYAVRRENRVGVTGLEPVTSAV